MRKVITFPGVLRGEGQESECIISATEVTLPGTSVSALANYSIQKVSKVLPEGHYQLIAQGETINIRHSEGNWLAES